MEEEQTGGEVILGLVWFNLALFSFFFCKRRRLLRLVRWGDLCGVGVPEWDGELEGDKACFLDDTCMGVMTDGGGITVTGEGVGQGWSG